MYRIVIAVVFAFGLVGGVMGSDPPRSLALQESATPEPEQPEEVCPVSETAAWDDRIVVESPEPFHALVEPLDSPDHRLYLVVWTINPGTCIPFDALGNQKDGAIVLVVQEGVVEFTAQPYAAGSAARVSWGSSDGESRRLDFGVTQRLEPGDWVAQDDQVWFTLRNAGETSAVILKAVWVLSLGDIKCAGGCR